MDARGILPDRTKHERPNPSRPLKYVLKDYGGSYAIKLGIWNSHISDYCSYQSINTRYKKKGKRERCALRTPKYRLHRTILPYPFHARHIRVREYTAPKPRSLAGVVRANQGHIVELKIHSKALDWPSWYMFERLKNQR